LYEESLELGRRMGLNHTILICLEGLARVAVAQGRMERAARLCGAAAALREDRGWPLPPVKRAEHERTVAAARGTWGRRVCGGVGNGPCAAFEGDRNRYSK
jgi:hypothetical protein